jgi:hypothetical protein
LHYSLLARSHSALNLPDDSRQTNAEHDEVPRSAAGSKSRFSYRVSWSFAEPMASQTNAGSSSEIVEISREEVLHRLHDSSLTIVDVLPEASYGEAHIPGAINIPLEILASRAREMLPDPAAEIAVYCGQFT